MNPHFMWTTAKAINIYIYLCIYIYFTIIIKHYSNLIK